MIFTEWVWVFLLIWVFLLAYNRVTGDEIVLSFGSLFGIIFGILYLPNSFFISLLMIFFNVYLLYKSVM